MKQEFREKVRYTNGIYKGFFKKHFLLLILLTSAIFIFWIFMVGMQPSSDKAILTSKSYVDINVKEMAGVDMVRPVTGGIPIAKGSATRGSRFVLLDKHNKSVPIQSEVLTTWDDGSTRWVLLDFQANPKIHGNDTFRLFWNSDVRKTQPAHPVKASSSGDNVLISSDKVQIRSIPGALLRISDRFDIKIILTNRNGIRCEAVADSYQLETSGKMRSTLALSGSFRTPEGMRVVDFRLRASVYAGLSRFYLEPQLLVNADTGMITYLNDLSVEFIPLNPIRSASIGGSPGWHDSVPLITPVRLFQVDDENYSFEGASGAGDKSPGWMEIDDGKGVMAITLRDFWQQWPKSIEVSSKTAKLGLLPYFTAGTFDHMEPWYKYDYLFEGNSYRLREGQSRRWQVWVDLSGNGEALSKSVNSHLVPAADPVYAINTGEWGSIAPAGKGMAEYDTWADNLFEGYCQAIREQRDYGAMNWGDWWGERGVNWGNNEYDTPLHILTQFARTGDPKYLYVGQQSARHYSEVDVIHSVNNELEKYFSQWENSAYPSRPGMVHQHSVGHVGGFYPVEKIKELWKSF